MTERPRPDAAFLEAQWQAQARAHRAAGARHLVEKIATLLVMQRQLLPVIAARRPLREWEQPWKIEA